MCSHYSLKLNQTQPTTVRQISCHVTSLPWQEPEEELVSFSSDEGLRWRVKREGKSLLVVFDLIFIINALCVILLCQIIWDGIEV